MPEATDRLGVTLGDRYLIERSADGELRVLGQGGMAIVYAGVDLRHRRKVAVKVLRPNVAAVVGAERFLHEVEVTAGLQHPNILALHDSGMVALEPGGPTQPYYVMPLVEGESLRQRLSREIQIPIDEAVAIATAIGSALDYAHRHGVIHRDIKPENILLHEGHALVADFGIALAITAAGGSRLTDTGLALGTPQYMSPEQAAGQRDVTERTDIYALGCVLYEMLAGEPPFTGPTVQAIIAKAARDAPQALRVGRPSVPPWVDAAVAKALAKVPADRFGTAADFTAAIGVPTASGGPPVPPDRNRTRSIMYALAATATIAVAAAAWGRGRTPQAARPLPVRLALPLPERNGLRRIFGPSFALSPDGRHLVFRGEGQGGSRLFVRPLDEVRSTGLEGTEDGTAPFFSPDGRWVGFVTGAKLKKVLLQGGPVVTILDAGAALTGAAWGPGDLIVFTSDSTQGLRAVSAAGGSPRAITEPDRQAGDYAHQSPEVLPDGSAVLFAISSGSGQTSSVGAVSLTTGKVVRLAVRGRLPRYLSSGHLLVVRPDNTLEAIPFNPAGLALAGPPIALREAVTGSGYYSVGGDGTLVYSAFAKPATQIAIVTRDGVGSNVAALADGGFANPTFSPDGSRIVLYHAGTIWMYDVGQETATRVTPGPEDEAPTWEPDGQWISFNRFTRTGGAALARIRVGGTGQVEVLRSGSYCCMTWQSDGRTVVAQDWGLGTVGLKVLGRDSASAVVPLWDTDADVWSPKLSPDNRWLAYASDESGVADVYVRTYPHGGEPIKVSPMGGHSPVWARNGRELFYIAGDSVFSAPVLPGEPFRVGSRRALFKVFNLMPAGEVDYDAHPDGKHFVVVKRTADDGKEQLTIVLNGFAASAPNHAK